MRHVSDLYQRFFYELSKSLGLLDEGALSIVLATLAHARVPQLHVFLIIDKLLALCLIELLENVRVDGTLLLVYSHFAQKTAV